jgi:hypothetical protein
MSTAALLLLALVPPAPARGAEAPASIVRVPLGPAEAERRPYAIPCAPADTVEVDLPRPLAEWAGRGFTPDPERFAGDFVIEAARGQRRLFVTAVTAGAHRVLHVVLAGAEGRDRSLALEFLPAPAGLAWTTVAFAEPAAPPVPVVTLSPSPPGPPRREPTADSELGLLRTLRLLAGQTDAGAAAIAAANPALEFARQDGGPRSFGDFTLRGRFAVRDATTDSLGVCVDVANPTERRLLFDPASWVLRAGDHVYPVPTADFSGEVEPGATAAALLVLAHGPDGAPTRLRPDTPFEPSVVLLGSASPRPVLRSAVTGMDPP